MLYPFFGKPPENPEDPDSGRYDRYIEVGSTFFQITSLPSADLAVFPAPYEKVVGEKEKESMFWEFYKKCTKMGKPVVVFFWSDSDLPLYGESLWVFRTSLYASQRKKRELAFPCFVEDFVERYFSGVLPIRKKAYPPTVGFCGYVPFSGPFTLKKFLRKSVYNLKKMYKKIRNETLTSDALVRRKAIYHLSTAKGIQTNFLIRDQFLGGALLRNGKEDLEKKRKTRLEYVKNMADSDYILVARGAGNYSYRLYETLSSGRIPLFINTDCVLPFEKEIPWKEISVWVEEKEIQKIGEKVLTFHESLSPGEFENLQKTVRQIWLDYLSPTGFFRNFHLHFSHR
jgi:hypothetical protein